jgi:hypothetical protein
VTLSPLTKKEELPPVVELKSGALVAAGLTPGPLPQLMGQPAPLLPALQVKEYRVRRQEPVLRHFAYCVSFHFSVQFTAFTSENRVIYCIFVCFIKENKETSFSQR